MVEYFQYVFLLLCLMTLYQLYSFSATRTGIDRQVRCQVLGVLYLTLGTVCLLIRIPPFVIAALVLLMMGFRLVALGLDRIDKKIYIDRYGEKNETDGK